MQEHCRLPLFYYMEFKFKAVLKKIQSDEDGEGLLILQIPLTEMPLILGLNLQVKKILEVIIKNE
jgi:hypothetical protein